MQNWDSLPPANYELSLYNAMYQQTIKQEPQSHASPSFSNQFEHYMNMKQQDLPSVMTPSPRAADPNFNPNLGLMSGDVNNQHYYEGSAGMVQPHIPMGFNPLTPPGLPNVVLPPMPRYYPTPQPHPVPMESMQSASPEPQTNISLTPRNTPPIDVTPPKSPRLSTSTSSEVDPENTSSNSSQDTKYTENDEDDSIRKPVYNSHGKMKSYKCKNCGFCAITKVAFWEHTRIHMKPEKILECDKCPFVTELKHHLEYHIRKHKNLKPFRCDKCDYRCVNKSMLNSHSKSHSSVYQYHCATCVYATKYCHSFKLHCRTNFHQPGVVLDEDGVPNPSIVIDIYGSRRGPKTKSKRKQPATASKASQRNTAPKVMAKRSKEVPINSPHIPAPPSPAEISNSTSSEIPAINQQMQPNQGSEPAAPESATHVDHPQHLANLPSLYPSLAALLQQQGNLPLLSYWNLNLQMLAAQQQVLAQLSPRLDDSAMQSLECKREDDGTEPSNNEEIEQTDNGEDSAMDLSASSPIKNPTDFSTKTNEPVQVETPVVSTPIQSRRKGRVLRLDTDLQAQLNSMSPKSEVAPNSRPSEMSTSASFDESSKDENQPQSSKSARKCGNRTPAQTPTPTPLPTTTPKGNYYECKFCDIFFRDAVLYTIHMGYHSCDDVFKCNMCGENCDGAVGLFVHMARTSHS